MKENPCKNLTNNDKEQSLRAYKKALIGYEQHQEEVPVELYCNIGVLYSSLDRDHLAKEQFLKGLGDDKSKWTSTKLITSYYNLGLVHEKLAEYAEAEDIYKDIVENQKRYTDAYLRLGAIAMKRGQHESALKYFKDATEKSPKSLVAGLMLGLGYMEMGLTKKAQAKFNQVLGKINAHEAYLHLCKCNFRLMRMQASSSKYSVSNEISPILTLMFK